MHVTGLRAGHLVTIAVDRATGRVLWERTAPEVKTKLVDKRNNPASPSPAVEENGVYVFFPTTGSSRTTGLGASGGSCRSDPLPTSMAWAPRR